jgi:hypothetical protein
VTSIGEVSLIVLPIDVPDVLMADLHPVLDVLVLVTEAHGIPVSNPKMALLVLVKDMDASSVYHCRNVARNNATQVGPLELVRAMGETLYQIEVLDAVPDTVPGAHVLISSVLAGLESVYKVIEDTWFTGETLSEEEVYRRFVQQQ